MRAKFEFPLEMYVPLIKELLPTKHYFVEPTPKSTIKSTFNYNTIPNATILTCAILIIIFPTHPYKLCLLPYNLLPRVVLGLCTE